MKDKCGMKIKDGTSGLNSGFTYIELLIVTALFSVIISSIYTLLTANIKVYSSQGNTMAMTQGVRAALVIMTKDMKMAKYDPTGNAGACIITADISEFKFQIDWNENGTILSSSSDPSEELRYALSPDENRDGIADESPSKIGLASWAGGLQPVVEDITKLEFTYYDKENNVLTPLPLSSENIEKIKSIEILIISETPNPDPILNVKKSKTITTRVMLRNSGL